MKTSPTDNKFTLIQDTGAQKFKRNTNNNQT